METETATSTAKTLAPMSDLIVVRHPTRPEVTVVTDRRTRAAVEFSYHELATLAQWASDHRGIQAVPF